MDVNEKAADEDEIHTSWAVYMERCNVDNGQSPLGQGKSPAYIFNQDCTRDRRITELAKLGTYQFGRTHS